MTEPQVDSSRYKREDTFEIRSLGPCWSWSGPRCDPILLAVCAHVFWATLGPNTQLTTSKKQGRMDVTLSDLCSFNQPTSAADLREHTTELITFSSFKTTQFCELLWTFHRQRFTQFTQIFGSFCKFGKCFTFHSWCKNIMSLWSSDSCIYLLKRAGE